MNDVRDAIERIGEAFDPRNGGFEDLARRRKRLRARHRVVAGALAAIVAVGGTLLTVRAFSATNPTPTPTIDPATSGPTTKTSTACPGPPKDGSPIVTFSSTSGPAGSSVEVSGRFQTGERWLQVWWNADEGTIPTRLSPPPWPATGPELRFGPTSKGPVLQVAAVAGPGSKPDCSFRTAFTVPDVEPGTYEVLRVSGIVNPPSDEAYALLSGPITFEVTG
jgi:hypothetical protein